MKQLRNQLAAQCKDRETDVDFPADFLMVSLTLKQSWDVLEYVDMTETLCLYYELPSWTGTVSRASSALPSQSALSHQGLHQSHFLQSWHRHTVASIDQTIVQIGIKIRNSLSGNMAIWGKKLMRFDKSFFSLGWGVLFWLDQNWCIFAKLHWERFFLFTGVTWSRTGCYYWRKRQRRRQELVRGWWHTFL